MAELVAAGAHGAQAVERAAQVLRQGGLVAFPTDTVYGLAADVWNPEAVARIYLVKGRPELKAVPVLLSGAEELPKVAQAQPEHVLALCRRYWPGPLTLVVTRLASIPQAVSRTDTIGVRAPDHALARQLLARVGPLAVTSANRSGRPSARTAEEVAAALGGQIELIVDGGRTPGGVPSTVVDCTVEPARLLREGPIQLDEIHRSLREIRTAESESTRG